MRKDSMKESMNPILEDIRFVTKGDILYAHVLAWPENNKVVIKSLADGSSLLEGSVKGISLLGSNEVISFTKTTDGLVVNLPKEYKTE